MSLDQKNNLLGMTLSAASADCQSVTADRKSINSAMPEGMSFRPTPAQRDSRGRLVEMFDPRWNWHPDPLVYVYYTTLKPKVVKGWALHKLNIDRYFVIVGEVEVVTYDVRPDSPTCGLLSRIVLSAAEPGVLNIPCHVWHADVNLAVGESILVNMPTQQYDHENPDKYRLPLNTPLIPYEFPSTMHGW